MAQPTPSWRARPWLLALAALTAARLAAAALLPPAPDEAYYWVWGRSLQPGYLDHPPMVALWIAAGTALLGDTAAGIRLLGPIGVALASLALADAGDRLFPGRRAGHHVGLWAAIAFNAMPLTNAGAVLMTPDTPLIVFWCATLWAAARLASGADGRWWLALGAFAGAALASKYTAVFLGLGLLLWLALDPAARRWWRDPRLYAGGLLAALLFAPVIAWNAAHGWASFAKQGSRAAAGGGFTPRFLLELIGGQLLVASPLLLVAVAAGTALAALAWLRRRDSAAGLTAALVLPATALFLWQATGSRVQGNWPAILYPAGCLAAAAFASPRLLRPGALLGLILTALVALQAVASPLPLPRRSDPVLARLAGWEDLARDAEAARRAAGADFIAAEEYGLAAELALHLPRGVPVVVLGDRWSLFRLPPPPEGRTGLLLHSTRRGAEAIEWPAPQPIGELTRSRHGIEAERYRTVLVRTPPGSHPAALLPAPR